jgi:ACS family hexuronate transporter-like MFS transporter
VKTNYRYTILGLLFLATTINYIDRQIIGLLKPILEKEFSWTEKDYADIVFWFQVMYAIGYLLAGRFVDKVGAKIGYGVAVFIWSVAAMAHALARSTMGFIAARSALGFAEGGNMPSVIKSIAEWFPIKERSFASGFMISGTTVGPIIAPFIVLWLANNYSWQVSFIVTGALGLLWVIAWYFLYDHPEKARKVNAEELVYIHSDNKISGGNSSNETVPLKILLRKKATWGYFGATMFTDPVWWFYLFWLPSYLTSKGMSKTEIAFPITVVYAVTAVLSITGGWFSSYLIKIGWSVNRSRKTVMLICLCMALLVTLIRFSPDIWLSVFIISIAAAAQTIWKGVLMTTVPDQFPRKAVSSVAGIGGVGGAVGGMLVAKGVGILLDNYKSNHNIQAGYNLLFVFCGLSYVIAISWFHLLSPKLEKIEI